MTHEQEEILLKAIQTFGFDNQLCKLMEECGELIQAANKYREKRSQPNAANLLSEMADVEILIAQFRLEMDAECFMRAVKDDKIERLKNKIEKAV